MSDGEGLPGHSDTEDLARDLSIFDITMIGAGIFVLTGLAAGQAGPGLVMAFAFNGFITIFTGMVYAELSSAIPEAGGGYLWVREALGRSQAFLADRQTELTEKDVEIDIAVETGDDIAQEILRYARDEGFTSIIIGAAGEGILRRVLFGEIPETVGTSFEGEVVMVRKHRPVQSAVKGFIRKWVGKGARVTNLGEES